LSDPLLEVEGSGEYSVGLTGFAAAASVAYISVNFPFTTNIAYIWTTGVTVTSRFDGFASITSADHIGSYGNSDISVVLGVADRIGDNWQKCLLQWTHGHASWVPHLAPSSNVAFRSNGRISRWQTGRLDPFVEFYWPA
jgi:hypothetical protein